MTFSVVYEVTQRCMVETEADSAQHAVDRIALVFEQDMLPEAADVLSSIGRIDEVYGDDGLPQDVRSGRVIQR